MIFTKAELNFLKLYVALSDTKSLLNDKVCIKFNKDSNEVIFAQMSKKFNLIKKISKNLDDLDKDYQIVIETNILYQLINSVADNTEIKIIPEKYEIKFNRSKYNLKNYDGDYSIIEHFFSLKKLSSINISELNRMIPLKSYCGVDGLDAISLIEGTFQASNKVDVSGVIETSNDKNISYLFPIEFLNIVNLYTLESMELKLYEEDIKGIFISEDDLYIIINDINYNLENLLNDNIKGLYDHENKVVVSKNIFLEALKRIAIVSQSNIFNRIFMSFDTNNILLESIDVGYSIEKIPFVSLDQEIQNVKIILSNNYLRNIIMSLTGEVITIYISKESDAIAIKLEDENKDKFFVQVLYEDIDE